MKDELITQLLRRYAPAQRPLGRARLRWHVMWQRIYALWMTRSDEYLKRCADFTMSLLMLVMLSPLFLLIAVLIWVEDGGSALFTQTRVGRYGRHFKMFKFRSMCLNAEQRLAEVLARNEHKEGVTFKLKNDPRISRVGRYLRKYSLDELPQLYNVLLGNMSLVGPRPPVPREVARYTLADRRRLAVKPGLTCIWQISGRSEIDFTRQVELDVNYIEQQTIWMDFLILAKTVPAVISGRGAC